MVGCHQGSRRKKRKGSAPFGNQSRQHRAHGSAAWNHLRLCRAHGGNQLCGVAKARIRWRRAGSEQGAYCLLPSGWSPSTEQDERGYSLRSRCDLVCDGRAPLELVHADGSVDHLEIDREEARRLYSEAYAAALKAGFELAREPIQLVRRTNLWRSSAAASSSPWKARAARQASRHDPAPRD